MAKAPDKHSQATNGLAHLDALLQHRSRLGACVLLSTAEGLSFGRLKQLLEETDGNLGAQLRKLEDEAYIAADKQFVERKPVTSYSLTSKGRTALKAHLAALGQLIQSANSSGHS